MYVFVGPLRFNGLTIFFYKRHGPSGNHAGRGEQWRISLLPTEEHVAGESRDAGAKWYAVVAEVAAVCFEFLIFDAVLLAAAVQGVDGPVDELVALQLARLVVGDLVACQQPVTEETNPASERQHL